MTCSSNSVFDGPREEWKKNLGASVVKGLETRGHHACYVDTKEEALEKVLELIPGEVSVGIPGSVTIREIGAIEALKKRGNKVTHHWDPSIPAEDKAKTLKEELASDVFLTSSNAFTYDGMLVNIDGAGNRVAGMCWTGNKIIYVISLNKACPNVDSAIRRVRDKATPMNAIKLGFEVPCAKVGYHTGCKAPKTLCRALLILENATMGRDSQVILVGEDLGY